MASKKNVAQALKDFIDSHAIKQCELAEILGITPAAISNILSGRYDISKNIASQLHKVYGMNTMFLMTGEGDLLKPLNSQSIGAVNNSTVIQENHSPISISDPTAAALEAENKRLREEVKWLRQMLENANRVQAQ